MFSIYLLPYKLQSSQKIYFKRPPSVLATVFVFSAVLKLITRFLVWGHMMGTENTCLKYQRVQYIYFIDQLF